MTTVNTAKLVGAFGGSQVEGETPSTEDNDVNININAETEGDGSGKTDEFGNEPADLDDDVEPNDGTLFLETANDFDEVNSAVEELELIHQALSTISTENLEVGQAVMLMTQTAVNNAVKRFGLNHEDCGVASTENVSLETIESSLEGVGKSIEEGIKQLKELLVKLFDNFRGFMSQAVSYATLVIKQNETLRKRIDKMESSNSSATDPVIALSSRLDGHYKAADFAGGIKALKIISTERYPKLQSVSKNDIGTTVVEAANESDLALYRIAKAGELVFPGCRVELNDKDQVTTKLFDGEEKKVKLPYRVRNEMLRTSDDIANGLKAYHTQTPIRKRVTANLNGLVNGSMIPEQRLALRHLVLMWGRQLRNEQNICTTANVTAMALTKAVMADLKARGE